MTAAFYDFLCFFFPLDWTVNNFRADPHSFSFYTAIIFLLGISVGLKKSFDTDGAIFRSMSPGQAEMMLSFIGEDGFMQPMTKLGKATSFDAESLIASGMIREVSAYKGKAYVISPDWYSRAKRHKRLLVKVSNKKR